MITPGTRHLVAPRWVPFVHTIRYKNLNLTGATFRTHIRRNWDALGAALINLTNAAAGAQGISIVTVTDAEGTHSDVTIQIDEANLEALEPPATSGVSPGADVPLVWDMHITPSGGTKYVSLRGTFTIQAGSTQNG